MLMKIFALFQQVVLLPLTLSQDAVAVQVDSMLLSMTQNRLLATVIQI